MRSVFLVVLLAIFATLLFELTALATEETSVNAALVAKAGEYLQRFKNEYYQGYLISMVGSLISSAGFFLVAVDPTAGTLAILLGLGISSIGSYIQFNSFRYIGQAGEFLETAARESR